MGRVHNFLLGRPCDEGLRQKKKKNTLPNPSREGERGYRADRGRANSPLSRGEREKKNAASQIASPRTKRGPAFPPAPRCRRPLACPSGRRARRGGGKHGPRPARDVEPCVPTVAMRPLAGHRDGDGSEEPRSRLDVLAIPSCLAALRHRGPVIDRYDPEGRFVRSPRVGPFARRLSVPSRLWLPLPGLARRRRRSAATRSTRSEDGLCVHGVQSGPLSEDTVPDLSACHPRHKAGRCHWTPVRSVHARPMRTSPLRFPGVASPSRSMRFPEGTCTGPGRDKHLISLWFPAAASSACPMMLSRFASRAK
jgi:hypothetical protein